MGDLINQAMNAQAVRAKGEKGRLMQLALQVEIRLLANQFNLEAIGLADGSHLASGDAK